MFGRRSWEIRSKLEISLPDPVSKTAGVPFGADFVCRQRLQFRNGGRPRPNGARRGDALVGPVRLLAGPGGHARRAHGRRRGQPRVPARRHRRRRARHGRRRAFRAARANVRPAAAAT
eukprot:3229166-Prymnesium_polylepis.1